MIYLAASIISSTSIFIIFRVAKNFACRLNLLITINYLTAALLGYIFMMRFSLHPFAQGIHWLPFAISLGVLFIAMFFLIGLSSQKAGITATTLANKMSLVFPVFFSLYWFSEQVTTTKYIALATALAAVVATLWKKDIARTNPAAVFLPLLLFAGSGFTDSLIKYIQATQITTGESGAFSTFVFLVAFLCGSALLAAGGGKWKRQLTWPTLLLGILLGMANFGSLYFFINALNMSRLDSSLVFALNNMLIVMLSATAGHFIFNEKMNRVNVAGFILAFVSLYFIL